MRKTLPFVFVALTLGFAGCANLDDSDGPAATQTQSSSLVGDFSLAEISGPLSMMNATLIGQIGDLEGLQHYATHVETYISEGYASISVIVDTGPEAGMALVDFWDLAALEDYDPEGEPPLSIVACSGKEPGVWEFDQMAEELDITVEIDEIDGANVVTVDYRGEIVDYRGFYYPDSDGYSVATESQIENLPRTIIEGTVSFELPQ